jgi:hypothetical protein
LQLAIKSDDILAVSKILNISDEDVPTNLKHISSGISLEQLDPLQQ